MDQELMEDEETEDEGGAANTKESSPYSLWRRIPAINPSSSKEASMRSTLSFFKSTNNRSILRLYLEESFFVYK